VDNHAIKGEQVVNAGQKRQNHQCGSHGQQLEASDFNSAYPSVEYSRRGSLQDQNRNPLSIYRKQVVSLSVYR
jgi:hypothetical protein